MKLFKTSDIRVVAEFQELFGFDLPSVQLVRRKRKSSGKRESYRSSLSKVQLSLLLLLLFFLLLPCYMLY